MARILVVDACEPLRDAPPAHPRIPAASDAPGRRRREALELCRIAQQVRAVASHPPLLACQVRPSPPGPKAAVSSSPGRQPPARILLVESYEPLRQTLRRMLESRHYRVLPASVHEAFEAWRQRGADLLILDLHMPGIDGLEALLEFRAAAPDLPIIVMSAGDPTRGLEVLADALRLGARGALAKPFRLLQLLDLVAEVLGPDLTSENGIMEGDQ
jgi:CheY-like chemotaxis protein